MNPEEKESFEKEIEEIDKDKSSIRDQTSVFKSSEAKEFKNNLNSLNIDKVDLHINANYCCRDCGKIPVIDFINETNIVKKCCKKKNMNIKEYYNKEIQKLEDLNLNLNIFNEDITSLTDEIIKYRKNKILSKDKNEGIIKAGVDYSFKNEDLMDDDRDRKGIPLYGNVIDDPEIPYYIKLINIINLDYNFIKPEDKKSHLKNIQNIIYFLKIKKNMKVVIYY